MNVLDTLKERGFVHQTTDETELREMLEHAPVTCYIGYDPTAESLHVGNLVTIMMLAHLQRAGHRPIAIVGGGTARVGDPSGKTELRKMLTEEQIETNLAGLREQLARFMRFDESPTGALMIDNADWLLSLKYIDFLRDIGRYFAVNQMIKAKGYADRLEREQGLSFIEFNYQILQAYDYLVLNKRYGCRIPLGGADKWGNIVDGVALVRRVEGVAAHAVTVELITTATGDKMGKTADGAVWLDASRTSVFDFYQYWRNVDDRDIRRFLALFTFVPIEDVDRLGSLEGKAASEINAAKETLALAVTALVHGEVEATKARDAARALFAGSGGDVGNVPSTTIARERLKAGVPITDLLVETGLVPSKKEARRKIDERAVAVGDAVVEDPRLSVTDAFVSDGHVMLRVGKKSFHRVVIGN
ncbi:MAG TPA: tyrosine--tRNA ligase [Blastocatellia bacterium]|nr:tyrosine--tRNA ligase [Blastocatellia bacterium]